MKVQPFTDGHHYQSWPHCMSTTGSKMNLQGCSMPDHIPTLGIWAAVLAVVLGTLWGSYVRPERVPPSIEWVLPPKGLFRNFRAYVHEYRAGLKTILSGYRTFSRRGQPFILPATGFESHVMLPREHINWIIDQPEDVLSLSAIQDKRLGLGHLLSSFSHASRLSVINATRIHLTRNLGKVQGVLVDEIRCATDAALGLDTQSWREVNLFDAMHVIAFQSNKRILFGQPLCYNKRFLHYQLRFARWFGIGMVLVGQLVPWPFGRFIGFLFAIPLAYYRTLGTSFVSPVFRERLQNMKRQRDDPAFAYNPPEDLITWICRTGLDSTDIKSLERAITTLTVTIESSSTVIATHLLLDILGSDPQQNYYEILRNEAESVFRTESDWSRSAALQKLERMDSAFRETLRRNPTSTRSLFRKVMPKEGVILPSGQHIPQGACIGVAIPGIHHDERFYDQPDMYNPFRFLSTVTTDGEIPATRRKEMAVTTSDTFLSFGHGRHACSGRWFVSHVIKLLLAYITVHYDIQPLPERPLNTIVGDHIVPPRQTTILVRRRKTAA